MVSGRERQSVAVAVGHGCDRGRRALFSLTTLLCSLLYEEKERMARIKQNGILGQLLRDSWLAFTEGLL